MNDAKDDVVEPIIFMDDYEKKKKESLLDKAKSVFSKFSIHIEKDENNNPELKIKYKD